jgi:hypothetical protein
MENVISYQINQKPPGSLFSVMDFLDLAKRNTINQTLSKLAKLGTIEKLGRGLYYVPRRHPIIGIVPPTVDEMVAAYAQKFDYLIQVSPAMAANLLGLSSQVPAKHIYLTDAQSTTLVLGGNKIILRQVCPKRLIGLNTKAGLILQALYYFGNSKLNNKVILQIRNLIDDDDKKLLTEWLSFMPSWMRDTVAKDILHV